ncbi:MAG: FecR domain-containing protein [Rhodospirillaceae bacterium]
MTDISANSKIPSATSASPKNAAEWVVRLDSDQAVWSDSEEFQAWYSASETNRREFSAHKEMWEAAGRLAVNADARAILMRPCVVHMPTSRRAVLGLLAGGAMAAGIALVFAPREPAPVELAFRTARGERKEVPLADGSALTLNTDSAVRVRYSEAARHIYLDRGQLFIRVAKDVHRPLRVFAKDHEVRAVGTAFDVLLDDEQQTTQVRLAEGIVAIYNLNGGRTMTSDERPSVVLKPGQQATLAALAPIGVFDVDRRAAEAWLNGRIIFDETPLSEAIRDVNRYRVRRIVIGNDGLSALRITGVFNTAQLEDFPEALTAALPVRVLRSDASTVVLTRR